MPTTTYMLLVLPTPGVTNDFTGEQQEIAAFTTVDSHDHSPGKGALVPVSGLSINADLPFAGFNASGLRAVRMNSQGSTLALLLDVNCIYSSGGNLYFNNGSGQAVQITSGATLSASSIGGISGLAAPASVAYSSGTYVFTSNTNIAAIVDVGPVIIRDTGASARGITLQSPVSLAAAYTVTLPAALPASTLPLVLSSAGLMSTTQLTTSQLSASAGILGTQIANTTVARGNMVAVGQQISSSCGAFTTASGALVDVTNLTVTITTTGRPVFLAMMSDGSGLGAQVFDSTSASIGQLALLRGATEIARWVACGVSGARSPGPPPHLDPVAAGTYTYKIQASSDGANNINVSRYVLGAYEL